MPAEDPEVFAASTTRGVGDHRRRRTLVGVSQLRPAGVFCGDRRRTLQIDGYGHPDDPLLANRVQHEAMRALVIDLVGLDCGA